ncbi:MAG: ribosome-associated translation inhibitor RaiA [Clostridia bacterium]|nr:ribosome-associated translation inhibitor RaiA [Clostridia bacterium]MBQ7046304.1 ribosome-associated translation inhibitor RaiA [Oscillospiraceae bacterium]
MKIVITGRKCSPRESFKERAEKKLAKIERFFGDEAEAKITATVEKSCQTVEITVMNSGMIFRAQERAENMNDALDRCVDSLVRQIRKNKTKLEKRMRSGAFEDIVDDSASVEEEKEYDLVRTKRVALKPQSVDEAILQMNMLGHEFYMFLNDASGLVSVVYRRTDGGYGLLEPDEE